MAKKPSATDATLVLQLYDLRREPEMRKARKWWTNEFWPRTADDFLKVGRAAGTQENNWLRQVAAYWGMAASFVELGVLNEQLFLRPGVSGEMFLMFAKIYPFLKELRIKLDDPEAFLEIEKVVMHTKWGRNRLQFLIKRLEAWRETMEKKAESK